MGMLQKLKSLLGLGRSGEPSRGGRPSGGPEANVTVEREPSTATEDAVKGTGTGQPDAGTDAAAEPAAETGAAASAEGAGGTAPAGTESVEAAASDAETGETSDSSEAPTEADTESTEGAGTDEDVTVLNGIGPAYGDRLGAAGIETVADLAAADAAAIAAETDLGEGRVQGWIDQARER